MECIKIDKYENTNMNKITNPQSYNILKCIMVKGVDQIQIPYSDYHLVAFPYKHCHCHFRLLFVFLFD